MYFFFFSFFFAHCEPLNGYFLEVGKGRPKSLIKLTENGTEINFASQWLGISPNSMISFRLVLVWLVSHFHKNRNFFKVQYFFLIISPNSMINFRLVSMISFTLSKKS